MSKEKNLDINSISNKVSNENREKNKASMEKNERLKSSIHEKLYSFNSMPDLLQHNGEEKDNLKTNEIKIFTGVEVVDECVQFETASEINIPKRPARVKLRRAPSIPVHETKNEKKSDENQSMEPPTSNSLKETQNESILQDEFIKQKYPSIDYSNKKSNIMRSDSPKSILKTGNEQSSSKSQHITFMDCPQDIPTDFDENEIFEECQDVWKTIEIHRYQLKRSQPIDNNFTQDCESDEFLPPLPKTPPPPLDNEQPYLRDFSFA